jgi:hypothetical protein
MLYGVVAREGMRSSEAFRMTWGDLDLERGAVRLDVNKTDHEVSMSNVASHVQAAIVSKSLATVFRLAVAETEPAPSTLRAVPDQKRADDFETAMRILAPVSPVIRRKAHQQAGLWPRGLDKKLHVMAFAAVRRAVLRSDDENPSATDIAIHLVDAYALITPRNGPWWGESCFIRSALDGVLRDGPYFKFANQINDAAAEMWSTVTVEVAA